MRFKCYNFLICILSFFFLNVLHSQQTNIAYQIGGINSDDIADIGFDDEGNMYVTGIFRGTVNFDPYGVIGTGDERTSKGECDIFIQKYRANNILFSPVEWTITIGGTGIDAVSVICVSKGPDPQIYIGGQYMNTVDFDPNPDNTVQYPAVSDKDAFFAGYDGNGNFQEFVYLPGMGNEHVTSLKLLGDSMLYIGGIFEDNISFDPIEQIIENSNGDYDMFIAKYKPSINKFLWKHTIGGSGMDELTCLDIDDADNLFFGGGFSENVDFDPSAAEHMMISVGDQDAFISSLDPDGNFQWVEKLGNSENNQTTALTIAGDSIWSASFFYNNMSIPVGFAGGIPILKFYSSNGGKDIFLQKYLTDGTNLTTDWCQIGGTQVDHVNDMDYDSRNNLVITGFCSGNNFDLNPDDANEELFQSNGSYDIFVAKMSGSYEYIWGNVMGSSKMDISRALSLGNNDDIIVVGSFRSEIDFNPWGTSSLFKSSRGDADGFVLNIKPYSDSCKIIAFTLPEQTGPTEINDTLFVVNIEVPYGSNVISLIPEITISENATIDPLSGTEQDFSDTVVYKVTAEDSITIRNWNVVVSVAPNNETDIISFELTEQTGIATINTTEHTIALEVENGTDLTTLIPTIELSDGAMIDPASGESRDFSDTVVYTVTAEDGTTRQEWTVSVSEAEATSIRNQDNPMVYIYPNPSDNRIYIKIGMEGMQKIELYGLNGKIYKQEILEGQRKMIDVSTLPAGLYVLKVYSPEKSFTRKIMIDER